MPVKFKLIVLVIILIITAVMVTSDATESAIFGDIFYESSRSLLLNSRTAKANEHKCEREVPAIFYQTMKHEPVRGNGSTIYYQRIEVCCEGYIRSPYDWHKCIPDCIGVSPNNCRNGFCRAPNQCVCFDEFIRNDRGECVHTCPIACQHGRCYLNGTCECNRGYTLDPQTRKFCRADCAQPCGNHQLCVAPGECACQDGYKMTEDLGCQPVCIPDCGYGKCVGPNQCECFSKYRKRPQRNVCEVDCYLNCENGFCESQLKCQCRDGYKYDINTTTCLPDCGDECQNGICTAPGVCRCFDGYELMGTSCEPVCKGGCGYYGKCVQPNICGCGISKQFCILGTCDVAGKCICAPSLTHFVDKCVNPTQLKSMVSTYDQRNYYNLRLKQEFYGLIGQNLQLK